MCDAIAAVVALLACTLLWRCWHVSAHGTLCNAIPPPPPWNPYRNTLGFTDQMLPGMVLQSDHLSTAVDNARQTLQLPRARKGERTGGKERKHSGHQRRRPSPKILRRASERLLTRFNAGGGGREGGHIKETPRGTSRKGKSDKRLLALGAELRGCWARTDCSNKFLGSLGRR